jgi:hypothetical protein
MQTAYISVESYVADYPAGESYANWMNGRTMAVPLAGPVPVSAKKPIVGFVVRQSPIAIVQGDGPHGGIEGGFLWARILLRLVDWRAGYAGGWYYVVAVHDCDDGLTVQRFDSWEAAEQALADLCTLAPVTMHDLVAAFGYEWDM